MTDVRVEEDLIGTCDVPADAYYGIHTVRALENFSFSDTSIGDLDTFIPAFVMVKKAAALANAELGAIPQDISKDIVAACDLILNDGRCLDQFPVDVYQGGAGTSSNMNVNEVIANLALEVRGEPKGRYDIISPFNHVNASQSTNDTYPTALRLAVHLAVEKLREELGRLAVSLDLKADEFADIITMGRTQLQDAVPITMGQQFAAFATLVREEIRNLHDQTRLLLEVNLGATAIGTAINTPLGYQEAAVQHLATISQLPVTAAADLVEATSDTGAYVSVHSGFKRVAIKLGKICNDLRLLSSGPRAGLGEINLPQRQAGSSIMPAKVNPVIPEVVNQVCYKVRGNDLTVEDAADAGQLQLNVMEPVIAQCVFESTSLLTSAAKTLRELCIDGITVNAETCRDYVMRSIGLVTFLNPVIGHDYGDLVGKKCAETGRTVREVVLEMGLMDEVAIDAVLSPENLTAPHRQRPRLPENT